MNNRLPVYIENLELPDKNVRGSKDNERNNSYGYVSIMYILSLMISVGSILTVLFLGK